jgi:hypothetical protein
MKRLQNNSGIGENRECFDWKIFDNQDQNVFDKNLKDFEQKKERV